MDIFYQTMFNILFFILLFGYLEFFISGNYAIKSSVRVKFSLKVTTSYKFDSLTRIWDAALYAVLGTVNFDISHAPFTIISEMKCVVCQILRINLYNSTMHVRRFAKLLIIETPRGHVKVMQPSRYVFFFYTIQRKVQDIYVESLMSKKSV